MNPGGKRWRIVLLILAAAVLAAITYHFIAGRGPKYEGRTVDWWFDECCRSGQFMRYEQMRHEEAVDALRHLGTNAVPYLLKEAFDTNVDSPTRSNYIRFIQSLPRSWGMKAPVPAQARWWEAPMALKEIKPSAKSVFPFLESQYRITNSPLNISRAQAIMVMGCLGEGAEMAVPDLTAALQDTDRWAPMMAVQSLDWLGPKAADAVPALVSYMESNTAHAILAARALGSIGVNDPAAVQVVRRMFDRETNWYWQCQEATASCRMDAGQTDALNFLVHELKNRVPASDRGFVARQLGEIGTNAQAAVPAPTEVMMKFEDPSNPSTWTFAADALRAIGVPSATLVEEIRPALRSKNELVRANAAGQIVQMYPADREALQVLMKAIQDNSALGRYATETLARAGPAAREAIPVLEEASKSKDADLAAEAKAALRRIKRDEEDK